MRVAINGFGRIGRTILRAGLNNREINFVAINDLTDIKTLVYLLKHDSVYGPLNEKIKTMKNSFAIGKNNIKIFSEKEPLKLPWKELGIDVVIESTGAFRTKEQASQHLDAGAKKVIISAPAQGESYVKTIIPGVNHKTLKKQDKILSNASCTTNCLAPLVYILDKEFGIKNGFMTTVHAYTSTQALVDAPNKDLRRGRAAATNIIPTTTGAIKAISLVLPELKRKINGMAIRVPVLDTSLIDLTVNLEKKTTEKQINNAFKKASIGELKNILKYSEEELVSSDIVGDPHAAIFDSKFTSVNGKIARVIAWYDNEYGYCNQLIKLIKLL